MSAVVRDEGRAAVYAAELAAFDGTDLETVVDFDAIEDLARRVVSAPWWPGGVVEVRRARSDARSSTTRCSTEASESSNIRLAGEQMTVATVAHELAHALAGLGAGHDDVFRRAYLDVVAVITNVDSVDRRHELHVDQLAVAFSAAGLTVGARRWPEPPATTTGAIAL